MEKKHTQKGIILLEALFAVLMFGMVAYGFAQTGAIEFSLKNAERTADQAKQYADAEADYIQKVGYDDIDSVLHSNLTDMSSLIGTTDTKWLSTVKLASTKTVSDEVTIKTLKVSVYQEGDGMPRYSLEVPLSSLGSSAGVPVGTVIAWPLGSDPSGIQEGRWLECNGQSVNSSKYPRLAALMSNVPDYRGMFLRGLGGNSASLGAYQGDAARGLKGFWGSYPWNGFSYGNVDDPNNAFYAIHFGGERASMLYKESQYIAYMYHYRYTLSGNKDSGYTLNETIERPTINYTGFGDGNIYFDSSRIWPTANEFRPVNKAVRYLIKAK